MVLLSRLRGRWTTLAPAWRRAIVATLVLRAGVALLALVAGGLLPGLDPVSVAGVPGTGFRGWTGSAAGTQGLGLVGAGLERFDALWYLAIARDGYPTGTAGVPGAAAFFPGAPLVIGLVGRLLLGRYLLAANLVAVVATIVALAGLHRLAEELGFDDDARRRAVLVAAVFPTSFFLLAPYSEAVFLAASVWSLVAARRRHWGIAAAAALAAGLTRNVGVLLIVPLTVEAGSAWRLTRADVGGGRAGAVLATIAGPAGAGLHLAAGWWRWGSPLAPVQAQTGWQRELTWPWETLVEAVRVAFATPGVYASGYHTLDLVVTVPVLAAVVAAFRRLPAALAGYGLAHAAVWLVFPFPARPLMSVPRFALVVVPVLLVFALWTRRPAVESAWTAASAVLLGVHATLFVTWYFVF